MSAHLVGFDIGLPKLRVKAAKAVGGEGEGIVEKRPQLLFAEPCKEQDTELRSGQRGPALVHVCQKGFVVS